MRSSDATCIRNDHGGLTAPIDGTCHSGISQPQLAGPATSDPLVMSELLGVLAGDLPQALRAIRPTRAAARERAWALAGDAAP